MKWIQKILDIEPYTITCLWNNDEIRKIDFSAFIKEKAKNPLGSYSQLKDEQRFNEAKCDGTTIYWENGIVIKNLEGQEEPGPLDIDPDILYEMSYKVEEGSYARNN